MYLKETYGTKNVQRRAYNLSQADLQKAMDDIYLAGLNNTINPVTGKAFGGGPRQTITITQDGKVFVSQNSNAVNPQSRIIAEQIFGDNVKFVKGGDGARRPNMSDNYGNHAETKGIYHLEKNNIPTEGVKQFSSHYSCDSCRDAQRSTGVLNYTGYACNHNNVQKRIDY